MRRTIMVALGALAILGTGCTTKVYLSKPNASTASSLVPTSQPVETTVPPSTTQLTDPPTLPPTTSTQVSTTMPPCTGEGVTVLPGEAQTLTFDNIQQQDGSYVVVFSSLVYNERSDPITKVEVMFSYVTTQGITGSGVGTTLALNSIAQGGSTAWTTDVSTASAVTSAAITSIGFIDVAAGPGCHETSS